MTLSIENKGENGKKARRYKMRSKIWILSALNGRIVLLAPVSTLILAMLLGALLLAVLLISLMNGSYPLTALQVAQTLLGEPASSSAEMVIWSFRFPRALVAMLVGAFLALSGAILQNITRNPLADPSLVGVSQGAGLAVVVLIVVMPDIAAYYRPMVAFAGGLGVALLIQWMSNNKPNDNAMRFILTGIGVAAFISALTAAILTYGDLNRALTALGWLAGSIHSSSWSEVIYLSTLAVLLLPILFWATRPLSALRMGVELAVSLGVNVRQSLASLLILSVLLAAAAVAAVGPLGFVGLIAPHVSKRLTHSGVGMHLLITAMVGALLVSLADFIGRTAFAPTQIPAGLVSAMIGVPIFVALILRRF